jgi:HTH-type transcriptional regulator/antitoxin HipB
LANLATPGALAELVRVRRKDFGLNQSDLADLAGVSARFVYDLERGKPTVAMDKVLAVTKCLGIVLTLEVGLSV